jgi:hypothetical protein
MLQNLSPRLFTDSVRQKNVMRTKADPTHQERHAGEKSNAVKHLRGFQRKETLGETTGIVLSAVPATRYGKWDFRCRTEQKETGRMEHEDFVGSRLESLQEVRRRKRIHLEDTRCVGQRSFQPGRVPGHGQHSELPKQHDDSNGLSSATLANATVIQLLGSDGYQGWRSKVVR